MPIVYKKVLLAQGTATVVESLDLTSDCNPAVHFYDPVDKFIFVFPKEEMFKLKKFLEELDDIIARKEDKIPLLELKKDKLKISRLSGKLMIHPQGYKDIRGKTAYVVIEDNHAKKLLAAINTLA